MEANECSKKWHGPCVRKCLRQGSLAGWPPCSAGAEKPERQRQKPGGISRLNSKKSTSKHLFPKKSKWDLLRDRKTNMETNKFKKKQETKEVVRMRKKIMMQWTEMTKSMNHLKRKKKQHPPKPDSREDSTKDLRVRTSVLNRKVHLSKQG